MADLFISYAREDHRVAQQLASVLEAHGWSVWWDRDLVPGERFQEVIEHELEQAVAVLVLWSTVSVRSQWVRSEASYAADRGVLIPVLTEQTAVPLRFRILQAVDLNGWDGAADEPRLQRLLAGVQTLAGPPSPPGARLPPPTRAVADSPSVDHDDAGGSADVRAPVKRAAPDGSPQRRSRLAVVGVVGVLLVGAVSTLVVTSLGRANDAADGGTVPPADTVPVDTAALGTPAPATPSTTATTTAVTTTTPPDSTTPVPTAPDGVLALGDSGPEVGEIQRWLRASGTDPGLKEDQQFGPQTERAVETFENAYGFAVNGQILVGGEEWRRLRSAADDATVGGSESNAGERAIEPAVTTSLGVIDRCADGLWITILGSFGDPGSAAEESQRFEGSGVLPSDSCPSLTAGSFLIVYGPFSLHDEGVALCQERGLLSSDHCYVKPIDLRTDYREWHPDGTFHDQPGG